MRNTKKRIVKKKYTRRTTRGGGNKSNLTKLLKTAKKIIHGENTMPEGPIKTNIIEEKINSLNEYQNKSTVINDFLRDELSNYCEKNIRDDSEEDFIEDMENDIEYVVDCIKELDELFMDSKVPIFDDQTVLFRGTDKYYSDEMSKAYISTTKTIDHLFYMMENGDEFVSNKAQCCLNVLIIDKKHKIPYLDLEVTPSENSHSKWGYQQEVLLPRGLKTDLLGEYTYNYAGIDFKTYVYKVKTVDNKEYKIPDNLDNYDHHNAEIKVESEDVNFLITNQKKEIDNILSYATLSNQEDMQTFYEEFQMIDEYITSMAYSGMIYFCTKKVYIKKCEIILTKLKEIVYMLKTVDNLCKPHCKDKLSDIQYKIDEMLKNEDYITSSNYIAIPKCT